MQQLKGYKHIHQFLLKCAMVNRNACFEIYKNLTCLYNAALLHDYLLI